jgi:L-amino acid N-acyltransferase
LRRKVVVRDATEDDLAAMVAMVNTEIADSPYVYAETPLTVEDRRDWLASHRSALLPVLVATEADDAENVVGWAALSPYRASSGYRFTAELSVYVARSAHRRGIGSELIAALLDRAERSGLHALVGSVDADNAPSLALLERFGFTEAGRLPDVGRKFDRWRTQLLVLHRLAP